MQTIKALQRNAVHHMSELMRGVTTPSASCSLISQLVDALGAPANVRTVLDGTDWTQFAGQKLALLHTIGTSFGDTQQALQGLLYFIDALQDAAENDGHTVVWLHDDSNEEIR